MLFDSRNEQQNVTINVDNTIQHAKASTLQKVMFYLLLVIASPFTLFFIWILPVKYKNKFNQKQVVAQEASSTIQAAQAKRRATLIKMMDSVKGYKTHEKELLEQITKYRSQIQDTNFNDLNNLQETQNLLSSVTNGLKITFEKYPDLKASSLYQQFSNEVVMQEDEIYSARRIYNARVTDFNSMLYKFPAIVVANNMKLHNLPFFTATELERQDVDTSSL
ncbi:LemA family protein [Mycoplasma zalophi]|uniref:LemA family protein n=1 Tax=Mycoplasma zalophi TaxID=191287 RepID=A0ABS6DQ21_9MOLU|nr:LemA family protein [Mycoplasma zalophi]MBU4690978.1 LemA family protein [Mycoplasma zalophi]MBU4692243.1 LemA family protein [Mycoplasma zalophi]